MAEWLGYWTSNLVVPGSCSPPCYLLHLSSVALSSTPWLHFVNRGSPTWLFDPAIPAKMFLQSRNPDGFYRPIPISVINDF